MSNSAQLKIKNEINHNRWKIKQTKAIYNETQKYSIHGDRTLTNIFKFSKLWKNLMAINDIAHLELIRYMYKCLSPEYSNKNHIGI